MLMVFKRWMLRGVPFLLAAAIVATTIALSPQSAFATVRTWDNGGGDGLWSTCTNWTGDACPGASDVATFDPAISDTPSTIDGSALSPGNPVSVSGINIMSGFTSTITQAVNLTVGTGNYVQAAGTFTGGSQTITNNGTFSLTGGTFTSTSGTFSQVKDFTIGSAGTFNANGGTVSFSGASASPIDVNVSQTFNNLTLNKSIVSTTATIATGDTLNVSGALTITHGTFNGGNINANGTFSYVSGTSTSGPGSTQIAFNTLQTISMANGDKLPGITLNVSGSSLTTNGTGTAATIGNNVVLTSGTSFTPSAGTTILHGLTIGAGTFTAGSSTLFFTSQNGSADSISRISGTGTFHNVVYQFNGFPAGGQMIFPSGITTTINGYMQLGIRTSEPYSSFTAKSDSSGVQATINVTDLAHSLIQTAAVQDLNNSSGTDIPCRVRCTDSGNNSGIYIGDPGILTTAISGHTSEAGSTATFAVVLRNQPTASVTVPVVSSDTTEATVVSPLTFTTSNWATPQSVMVTGPDDVLNDGGQAFTITVGPATSSDTHYSGLSGKSVTGVNDDNDSPDGSVDLSSTANATQEDIAAELGIGFYADSYYGHGSLKNPGNTAFIDLTGTKVKAGCVISIAGTEYEITRVWAPSTTGQITVTDAARTEPQTLDTSLTSGVVNYIHCLNVTTTGSAIHTTDFANDHDILTNVSGQVLVYDAANNALWGARSNTAFKINLSTDAITSIAIGSGTAEQQAIDTSRGIIWYPNASANTVTAITTSTGAYAFGTLGASSFATCVQPESVLYDAANDALFVLCSGGSSPGVPGIERLNPASGAAIGSTVSLSTVAGGSFSTRGLTLDTARGVLWASIDSGFNVVAVDSPGMAFHFGTMAQSTFFTAPTDLSFSNWHTIQYDSAHDALWVIDAQCDTNRDDFTQKIDAATGMVLGAYALSQCPQASIIDSTNGEILFSSDGSGSIPHLRLSDGVSLGRPPAKDSGEGIALDAQNDVWYEDPFSTASQRAIHEFVRNGSAVNSYYALTGTAGAELDVSTWSSINGVTVNDTTAGQLVDYAVSFDGRNTYSVDGVWRPIASNLASVHGGVNGNWYYRDDANTWTAAPANTPQQAIALAVQNGPTNNRMTGADLAALTSGDWASAGGFSAGVTTTLDMAAVLETTDAHNDPSVRGMDFSFSLASTGGGGGGGSGSTFVSGAAITAQTCTAVSLVNVDLSAQNATSYIVSIDGNFDTEEWQAFAPNVDPNSSGVPTMEVGVMLPEADGQYTISARFRSSTGNVSQTVSTSVTRDAATSCGTVTPPVEPPPTPTPEPTPPPTTGGGNVTVAHVGCMGIQQPGGLTRETAETGTSPFTGKIEPVVRVYPGDYIRAYNHDTVYCIDAQMHRKPFMDEITYFTHERSFTPLTWVTDATLPTLQIGPPMLPKVGVTLVKFPSSPSVYRLVANPDNTDYVILRQLVSEEVARANYGSNWPDYVIDINETLRPWVIFGDPIEGVELEDLDLFRPRALLNQAHATVEQGVIELANFGATALRSITDFQKRK